MVDFDSEATIASSAYDIERVQILKKREYFLEAVETYEKNIRKGIESSSHVTGARLMNLFFQLYSMLKRKLKEGDFDALEKRVKSEDYGQHVEAFLKLSEFLDELQLTKIDTKKNLGGNLVKRNKAQGWG